MRPLTPTKRIHAREFRVLVNPWIADEQKKNERRGDDPAPPRTNFSLTI
jgi:hypothetical protein